METESDTKILEVFFSIKKQVGNPKKSWFFLVVDRDLGRFRIRPFSYFPLLFESFFLFLILRILPASFELPVENGIWLSDCQLLQAF
jgi:hypothetical protein